MPKKMTVAALKKELKNLSQQETITLICSLYQSCPDAADILNAKFSGEDYIQGLLSDGKEKISKELSGRGMKVPSLSCTMSNALRILAICLGICQSPSMTVWKAYIAMSFPA